MCQLSENGERLKIVVDTYTQSKVHNYAKKINLHASIKGKPLINDSKSDFPRFR